MPRTTTHFIETNSKNYIRSLIDLFYPNGDALTRELTERDYGIDLVVEFFNDGIPTGNIAYIQVKGTEKVIEKNKRSEYVSCPRVSASSLEYGKQNKIPYVLIYVSIVEPKEFYYVDIQSLDFETLYKKATDNQSKETTVRIPASNVSKGNLKELFDLIKKYYK